MAVLDGSSFGILLGGEEQGEWVVVVVRGRVRVREVVVFVEDWSG